MSYFNVRVYGLLINEAGELLLSDERVGDRSFTKFPGGGLELGEGLREALRREFMEECNLEIEVLDHFYTTDFYEQSSFNDSQVLSIYYFVKALSEDNLKYTLELNDFTDDLDQSFRKIKLQDLSEADVTFRTDKTVLSLLKKHFNF